MKTRITIPTDTGTRYAFGAVAWLQVGSQKIKFLLQNKGAHAVPQLTHFASGQTFGQLVYVKLQHITTGYKLSDRDAAKILIAKVIKRRGINRVLATIASAEILNEV